jgi:hypothetical protein
MRVWRNRQVLSQQTSDSSAFLNAMWLFQVFTQLWTTFFIYLNPDYPTSGLTVTGLERVYSICFNNAFVLLLKWAVLHMCWYSRHQPRRLRRLCCSKLILILSTFHQCVRREVCASFVSDHCHRKRVRFCVHLCCFRLLSVCMAPTGKKIQQRFPCVGDSWL